MSMEVAEYEALERLIESRDDTRTLALAHGVSLNALLSLYAAKYARQTRVRARAACARLCAQCARAAHAEQSSGAGARVRCACGARRRDAAGHCRARGRGAVPAGAPRCACSRQALAQPCALQARFVLAELVADSALAPSAAFVRAGGDGWLTATRSGQAAAGVGAAARSRVDWRRQCAGAGARVRAV